MTESVGRKVDVKTIAQVSIVVKNLDKTIETYWKTLGIGPWDVHYMQPPKTWGLTYHGKPAEFTMKVAFAMVGQVELEIIEPTSGDNIYSDFLREKGEGVHHLLFLVDDVDATTKAMQTMGFALTQSGHQNDGYWAYYDTADALKVIWEVAQPPQDMPPDYSYPAES